MNEYKLLRRYHSVNGFDQCINNEYYILSCSIRCEWWQRSKHGEKTASEYKGRVLAKDSKDIK